MVYLRILGRVVLSFLGYLGELCQLALDTAVGLFRGKFRFRLVLQQIATIGFGSQLVVVVTGAFTGAVFAAQTYFKFSEFGVESSIGGIVGTAMGRELAPVLTGLMVAGRVGAAMAAEIGTMRVTEQIDALRAMAIPPVDYLVVPRFLGIVVSVPLLIAESIWFGLFASRVMSIFVLGIPEAAYDLHTAESVEIQDIAIGVIKGTVFGLLIVFISCHQGLNTTNGAVGVGKATTSAVVNSSLAILIFNFFLALLLNTFFPLGAQ